MTPGEHRRAVDELLDTVAALRATDDQAGAEIAEKLGLEDPLPSADVVFLVAPDMAERIAELVGDLPPERIRVARYLPAGEAYVVDAKAFRQATRGPGR